MKKRILSLLLAVSLLPMSVLADEAGGFTVKEIGHTDRTNSPFTVSKYNKETKTVSVVADAEAKGMLISLSLTAEGNFTHDGKQLYAGVFDGNTHKVSGKFDATKDKENGFLERLQLDLQ